MQKGNQLFFSDHRPSEMNCVCGRVGNVGRQIQLYAAPILNPALEIVTLSAMSSSFLEKGGGLHHVETLLKKQVQFCIPENYSYINPIHFSLCLQQWEKIIITYGYKFIDNANILAILELFKKINVKTKHIKFCYACILVFYAGSNIQFCDLGQYFNL